MDNFYNASTEEALSLIESIAKGRDAMTGPMVAAIKQIRLNTRKADCHEELAITQLCQLRELCTAILTRAFPTVLPIGHYAIEKSALEELRDMLAALARATNHQESGERK